MFDLDKFKAELYRRRAYIEKRIDERLKEHPKGGDRIGMDYEIKEFELDSVIKLVEFMENNDIS